MIDNWAHYSQSSNRDDRIIRSIDMCWFILEDVLVYTAAVLLDPIKRKSYIEELQSRYRGTALRAILGYAWFIKTKEGYGAQRCT
ncbi:hypothetical protein EDB81DRAFT_816487 [Dactylonectria macrodidyma]|uniref:Uncharacterized protein n=1 Tax=Dactylonectria macrodidyma TaxID=307937 RepID=A0A9P9DFN6_9HYPO|nr:hypothetical protein EDB81DRAFT_816487 [Dactylonectria macrodidyma]